MKKHLKQASEFYKEFFSKEQTIYPISEIDCEIICEIIELFKKCNYSDIATIIDKWKHSKDIEVRDALLEFNINFKKDIITNSQEAGNPLSKLFTPPKFIKLKSGAYYLNEIFFYCKEEGFYDSDNFYYTILLNKMPDTMQTRLYMDEHIKYKSEEERDREYDKLEEALKESGTIII
jgi:hypothetical protein